MPNNKDNKKSGSSAMGSGSDSEFEKLKKNPGSGKGDQGQMPETFGKKSREMDDDDEMTSGGRKGNFSDSERDSESQWSPGSTQSSDR